MPPRQQMGRAPCVTLAIPMFSRRAAGGRRRRTRSKRPVGMGYDLDLATCPAGGVRPQVKYDSHSPHVLVGGGSGNTMLDELNQTMHNKTSFRNTLFKYLPKDKKKRKRVIRELCKRLNITDKTEIEQINSIRQCCIDNDNSSLLNLGFKSVLSFVVWILISIGLFVGGIAGLSSNVGEIYNCAESKTKIPNNEAFKLSVGMAVSVLSLYGTTLTLPYSIIKPIIILFRGKSKSEKYNTMKAYLMDVNKT